MSLPIAKSLWNTKQRQGHSLHRICPYQGSFPPQLPAFFLDKYDGKVVLDPFCGRGTVILEAALRKRRAIGFDMLATARALSRVKVKCDARSKVLEEIAALNLNQNAPNVPADFENLYHPKTWGEVWSLKQSPRSDALTALTLGRLHGHSPGFFSGFTFNVISLPPASLERLRLKHNSELPYRDVKAILAKAANRFIPVEAHTSSGSIHDGDARNMPVNDVSVDLVITSPPFLDVIDYPNINWVREWFLGEPPQGDTFSIRNKEDYAKFLYDVLVELRRVLKPRAVAVFEVGPVKRQMDMATMVCDAAGGAGLVIDEVVVNSFGGKGVPKMSRAMRAVGSIGKETTTVDNHCLILRR